MRQMGSAMSMKASTCIRRWPSAQTALISLLVLCTVPAWAGSQLPLTSLSEIHKLSNVEANKAVPVAFEATVTYFRAYERTMFVQDGDTAIFVLATTTHKFQPGDRLLIRGITKGSFRPIVVSSDLTFLRHEALPHPPSATFVPLIQAKFDCRYVTIRGRIRLAADGLSSGRHVTQFELMMKGGATGVTVDEGVLPRLSDLLDAEAEVTGVVSGQFDGKMQETGVLLHATSLDDIKILHKAAVDPWSIPITPMDEVLTVS